MFLWGEEEVEAGKEEEEEEEECFAVEGRGETAEC